MKAEHSQASRRGRGGDWGGGESKGILRDREMELQEEGSLPSSFSGVGQQVECCVKPGVLGVGECGSWVLSAVPELASGASAVSCTCACVYFLRVGVSMHLLVKETEEEGQRDSQTCKTGYFIDMLLPS